ncbi:MAG: sel1 repeat family protein [Rhodocyclales bacterium]|nr:sel1 repeat family protein [Rhodocyclales bacterium]
MKRLIAGGAILAFVLMPVANAASHAGVSFCGGTVTPGDPIDLENQIGDMTLQAAVDQPASITTCAKGYLLAKCGDHENANKIFDRCIVAGYVGAMIWKALQVENGNGTERDLKEAADLLRQAAMSSDPAYGPLGRMHYATVLFEGRGVARDPEAAMKWFRQAAAEGSEEAAEFLRTGYHTGARDGSGMGAGTPTAAALAPMLSVPVANSGDAPGSSADGLVERRSPPRAIALAPRSATMPGLPQLQTGALSAEATIEGLQLNQASAAPARPAGGLGGLIWLLLAAFLAGVLFQRPAREVRVRVQLPHAAGA